MRIGDVARMVGLSTSTLRAWEHRYGALGPGRTGGGHRTYSELDVIRIRRILHRLGGSHQGGAGRPGVAEVVAAVLAEEAAERAVPICRRIEPAWAAVERGQPGDLRDVLLGALASGGPVAVFDHLVVPLLERLERLEHRVLLGRGEGRPGEGSAEPALARGALRGFVLELVYALPWTATGRRDRVLCFGPSGDHHDMGLFMAAVSLRLAGWDTVVPGGDLPVASAEAMAREIQPAAILVWAEERPAAEALMEKWSPPEGTSVVLGGAAFHAGDADRVPGAVVHQGRYADLAKVLEG